MLNNPDWSAVFAPRGTLLKEGDLIRRTNLSRTLSIIASEGPDAFYKVTLSFFCKIQFNSSLHRALLLTL